MNIIDEGTLQLLSKAVHVIESAEPKAVGF